MPVVAQRVPAIGGLVGLAASALLPIGGNDPIPAAPATREARAGLRTDVRSQTDGVTIGGVPTNMVLVPGGSGTMGVEEKTLLKLFENSDDRQHAERLVALYPEHVERVDDLLIDKYEVSNQQFKRWLDAHSLSPDETTIKFNWTYYQNGKPIEGLPPGQEQNPIRAISYDEAATCARWLGKRLPTELEWEYVGRRLLKKEQIYPWGSGFAAWDPTKCVNSAVATRGSQGFQTFKPGTFKDDCTIDGVFDLCGNVAEWTSSPFMSYPGFQPLDVKDGKQKKTLRGKFDGDENVVRGGCYFGNHLTCNLVWRIGSPRNAREEGTGFRCAMSALPGRDELRNSETALALLSADVKGKLEYSKEAIAGQVAQYVDAELNLVSGCRYFAFTKVASILSPILKVEHDSVEKPTLIAVLTTSAPIANPKLPAGSYAVYFKGKGLTEAQKKEAEAAEKKEKGDKADGDDKDPKGEKKDNKKDNGKGAGKGPKKGEPKEGGKPADGAKPADAAKPGDEAKKDEPSPEDEASKKALQEIGAEAAKPVSLVEIPADVNVLLFKDEADQIVACVPARYVEASLHATRFTYATGTSDTVRQTSAPAGGSPMLTPPRDTATLVFTVKMGTSNRHPEFELKLEFEAGSFEPVRPPAAPAPAAPKTPPR